MDALQMLDWIDAAEEPMSSTPQKRPGTAGSSSVSKARRLEGSRRGDSPGSEVTSVGVGDSTVKVCVGCKRIQDQPSLLCGADDKVEWPYPDKRGSWCALCHNVWRTYFRTDTTLADLGRSIQVNGEAREEFVQVLLAFVMMRKEGVERISKDSLMGKVQSIRGLMSTMNLPFAPSVIVPMAQLGEDEKEGLARAPRVNLQTAPGEFAVGVAVPLKKRPALVATLSSGYVGSNSAVLHDYGRLVCNGNDTLPLVASGVVVDGGAKAPLRLGKNTGLAAKVEVCVGQTKAAINVLAADGWADKAREAALTQPLARLAVLLGECEAACASALKETVSQWRDFAACVKLFIHMYREYKKRYMHDRLLDLADVLQKLMSSWPTMMHVPTAPSFAALVLQVTFHKTCQADGLEVMSASLDKVMAGAPSSFPHRLSAGGASEEVTLEPWLRQLLFRALSLWMEEQGIEQATTSARLLHDGLDDIHGKLVTNGGISALVNELGELAIVVKPLAGEKASPLELQTTLARIEKEVPARHILALFESPFGKVIKEKASHAVVRSAQDAAGDERIGSIEKALASESWLRWVATGAPDHGWTLQNVDALRTGFVYDSMGECVDALHEALTSWSEIHRAEETRAAAAALGRILKAAEVVEATCALEMHEQVRPAAAALAKAWGARATKELMPFLQSAASRDLWRLFSAASKGCSQEEFDRAAALVESLDKMVQSPLMSSAPGLKEFAEQVSVLATSLGMRVEVKVLCEHLGAVTESSNLDTLIKLAQGIKWLRQNGKEFPLLAPASGEKRKVASIYNFGNARVGLESEHQIPSALVSSEFADAVLSEVTGAVSTTLVEFRDKGLLAHINPSSLPSDASPEVALSTLVHVPEQTRAECVATVNSVCTERTGASGFPASLALARLHRLVKASGLERVDATALFARLPAGSPTRPVAMVFAVAQRYDLLHRMAVCIVRLQEAAPTSSWEGQLVQNALRPDVVFALDELASLVGEFDSFGLSVCADVGKGEPWRLSDEQMRGFVKGVAKTMQDCRLYFFGLAMRGIDALCGELSRMSPPYESFINDVHFHAGLARAQVLDWPHREKLAPLAKQLHQLMMNASELRSSWKLVTDEAGGMFEKTQTKAAETLTVCKKAIAVMAAVDLLEGVGKTALGRSAVASALLTKSALMLAALTKALRTVAAAP